MIIMVNEPFVGLGVDLDEVEIDVGEDMRDAFGEDESSEKVEKVDKPIPLATPATLGTPAPYPLKDELRLVDEADKLFDFKESGLTGAQQLFIVALMKYGTRTKACKATGIDPRKVTAWEKNEDFVAVYDAAMGAIADALEEEAIRRAMEGSDKLLEKLLKAFKPEKYADRKVNTHEGKVDIEIKSWSDLAQKAIEVVDAEYEEVEDDEET